MIYEIRNKDLTVKVNSVGAELISAISNTSKNEFIWQGDAKYWTGQAPILFPFTGRLFNKAYSYNDKKYDMDLHGFARKSGFKLIKNEDDEIIFLLESNEDTLKIYPFIFNLLISYKLVANKLKIGITVLNLDKKPMIFSYGFHPGFNIDESSYLEFNFVCHIIDIL